MTTEIERWIGRDAGPPPPVDGLKATVVVLDEESCQSARFLLLALRNFDASVWIFHPEFGSLQLTDRGRDTRGRQHLRLHFNQGTEIVATITGPGAKEALEAFKLMAQTPTPERRALYRERYLTRRQLRQEAARATVVALARGRSEIREASWT